MKRLLTLALACWWALAFGAPQSVTQPTHITIVASSDPTVGVLPTYNDAFANWQNAGLLKTGGIPNRTTQCGATVNPTGIVPPAANDDVVVIDNAITACTAGQFVLLAAGATASFTGSISGTALTITSGSGETVGQIVGGNGVLPGTMIMSGSGNSWVVNMTQTVASTAMSSTTPFNLDQSEYIHLNKGVSIRGSGSCTRPFQPYCPTVINVYNGSLADWSISPTTDGQNCGVTSATSSICNSPAGVILMSPSGNFNWAWAGCNFGVTPTGCGTTLAADAAQGTTTIQIAAQTHISVGMWVLIDENPQVVSTTNPTGGAAIQASSDFLSSSGSPATLRLAGGDFPTAYSYNPNRLNEELHLVTGLGPGPCPGTNCTITFDDPLTLAFRQSGSHNAQVYWPTVQSSATTANPFLNGAGVENLTITRSANGGISSTFCAGCWVKGVEVGGWTNGAVDEVYAARNQVEGNYFHDCYDCENNGTEYPIGISQATTETYVVNNIVLRGGKGMVGRAANTAVVAYNYVDDTFYQSASIGDYWQDMGVNGSHYAGTHHFLFEGNFGDNCDNDETHGNAIYHVYFRNWCAGVRTPFTDPSQGKLVNDPTGSCWGNQAVAMGCAPLRAAGPMAFDYWTAYAGNVLGTSGVTTTGNGWVYQNSTEGNPAIWKSGWTGSEWPGPDTNLTTAVSPNWIFRHRNFDYVRNALDSTTGFSTTLPNSFYLGAAPPFFTGTNCAYPWPWINSSGTPPILTPTGTGCTATDGLPAKARWDAGTPFVQP